MSFQKTLLNTKLKHPPYSSIVLTGKSTEKRLQWKSTQRSSSTQKPNGHAPLPSHAHRFLKQALLSCQSSLDDVLVQRRHEQFCILLSILS